MIELSSAATVDESVMLLEWVGTLVDDVEMGQTFMGILFTCENFSVTNLTHSSLA